MYIKALILCSAIQRMFGAAFCIAVCSLIPLGVHASLPDDSGIINVKLFGAVGDGTSDDTSAIQRAIDAARVPQGRFFWPSRPIYFPAGIYKISRTLRRTNDEGSFDHSMTLIGESKDNVILRLADRSPGFGSCERPMAMIYTSSGLVEGDPRAGGKDYRGLGEGNEAYGNHLRSMTLEIGSGNGGAVAVDFLANNIGSLRDLRIRAPLHSGCVGVSMTRKWPGPLLISDVEVDGFDIGISIRHNEYNVVLEDIKLSNQRRVGIRNEGNSISMRSATFHNVALPFQNLTSDSFAVLDQTLVTGVIDVDRGWVENDGHLVLGKTTLVSTSPRDALANGVSGVYSGRKPLVAYSAGWAQVDTRRPAIATVPVARWANVQKFGAVPDKAFDSTKAIQAAFDSHAPVVYFPSGSYAVSSPIIVPSHVVALMGMQSSISIRHPRSSSLSREEGLIRVQSAGASLLIDSLALDNMELGNQVGIEHSGARELFLRDVITGGVDIRRSASGGRLFGENICCGTLTVDGPAQVLLSQFNSEGTATRITNNGSPLNILGLKVEQNCTVAAVARGRRSDILGGLIYQVQVPGEEKPAFTVSQGSRLYIAYAEAAYIPGSSYRIHIQIHERDGFVQRDAGEFPKRGKLARSVPGVVVEAR